MDTQLLESAKEDFLLGDPVDEVVLLIEKKSANLNHSSSKYRMLFVEILHKSTSGVLSKDAHCQ